MCSEVDFTEEGDGIPPPSGEGFILQLIWNQTSKLIPEELCQGLSLFLFSSVTFKVHQHYEFNGCEFFVLFIWLKVDSENLALQFRREKWMHLYGTGPLWNILGPRKIIFWLYFSIGLINISLGLFRESKKVSVLNFDPMQRGPNLLQRQPN